MSEDRDLPTFLWDPEVNRSINEALPDLILDFFAIITRMGDGATLVALAIIFYWFGHRWDWRKRGLLLAIAVATLSLNAGIKGILAIPRPLYVAEPAFAFAPEAYDGYSTPSAHAMGAAAIYGGLAVLMDIGKKWQRYLVAAFLITSVAMSRVVIGVHYLGDVVTGVAAGLLLIWFGLWLMDEQPRSIMPMFTLALVAALVANVLGSEEFVTMSIGASIGGLVGWAYVHDKDARPLGASMLMLGAIIVTALLAFRVVEALITVEILIEVGPWELPIMPGIRSAGYGMLFALALAVPVLAEQMDDWDSVQRLQEVLPFDGRVFEPEKLPHPGAEDS